MKKFFLRSLLFLLPFFVILFIELFMVPIDVFTFRAWESLVVRKYKTVLPGPFYPNQTLTKVEEGDLAHHTPFAIKKTVQWITDRHGFRKWNTDTKKYPMVIIGDSNIAGASLSQEEMLSEVLEADLGISVYPFAPAGMNSFLKEERFKEHPPDIVIYARVERELFDLSPIKLRRDWKWVSRLKNRVRHLDFLQAIFIYLDRMAKGNMLHYLRASLRRSFRGTQTHSQRGMESIYGRLFFLPQAKEGQSISKEKIRNIAEVIRSYRDAMASRGIRFIFLPIPDKENIFHELLQISKPTFLEQLTDELEREGVETLHTVKAFEEAFREKQILLYHPDDTHWNVHGVKLAATLIKKRLTNEK